LSRRSITLDLWKTVAFWLVLVSPARYGLLSKAGKSTEMRIKIGLKEIAALQPHTILWDSQIAGFCARRQFSGVITYSVYFRTRDGQQRFYKIGRHGVFTPSLARLEAAQVLRNVAVGKDPGAELKALRHGPTMAELCDEYQKRANGKKISTIKSDASRIAAHIKPKLGKLKVVSVTQTQVEDFMRSLSAGSAKRVTGLLGAIFTFAIKKGMRPDNPVHGVEKPADNKKMRRLSNSEYAQLGEALNGASVAPIAASVIKLLILTGWRSSEAKDLKWSELDLPRHIANLGDTKSGASVRPLSVEAIKIIEAQQRRGPYVFEYERARPISNLRPHWLNLELGKDITPHTLRHSFASLAADLGFSDNVIAGMLGHARSSITSRYIHLEKALIEASDAVAQETLRLMRS
jgi:site-specific recombinase XerD